ncbi:hypothetical protein [Salipiger aestuarii]|uniref:hypothetical protein n=1 Tax=Salipiger aestuarii TaxID=568098 RepID=UPI0012399AFA|nr:hypothetical protein [Salipiger aestuarii]KAA8606811.1 hypothetical protein AL037_19835 [Salipiger aestuarii]
MTRTPTKSAAAAKTPAAKAADDATQTPDQATPAKAAETTTTPADTNTTALAQAPKVTPSPAAPAKAQIAPQVADEADAATITITCLRPEGRRRAGRRWDEGETVIAETALSDFDLAVLEADPMFRVER